MTLFRIVRRHRNAGLIGFIPTLALVHLTGFLLPDVLVGTVRASYGLADYQSTQHGVDEDGARMAAVGDVNGDGYSDIAIGVPEDTASGSADGAVRVFLGSASGMSTVAASTILPPPGGGLFGWSVSGGDVNGDGYGDVLVGSVTYSNGQAAEGGAFLYLGGAGGLNTTPAWSFESNQSLAKAGWAVAVVGDVNGDGRADAVIGTPFWNNAANTDEGKIDVFLGVAGGLAVAPAATRLGGAAQRRFGMVLSPCGDLNGDGRADVLVGAPTDNSGPLLSQGRAFVYLGSGSSIAASPVLTLAGQTSDLFGYVAGTGDVNGDGYADFLVGAPGAGVADQGRVRLYLGGAALTNVAAWSVDADSTGEDAIGKSLGTAGDANGDGYADFAIGHSSDPAGDNEVDVYYGKSVISSGLVSEVLSASNGLPTGDYPGVLTAGDVNSDGLGDLMVAVHLSLFPTLGDVWLFRATVGRLGTGASESVEPNVASAHYGHALALGDVNGDGFEDVIVGADTWTNGENSEGRVLLHLGGVPYPSATAAWFYESNNISAELGDAVSAGDVNGDGYLDVIAGAGRFSNGQANEGKVFAFHGSPAGPALSPSWSVEGNQVGLIFGTSASTAGDVNGDGYGDVIVGAPGFTNGQASEGQVLVYLGGASGLAAVPAWSIEMNVASAFLGRAVGDAGDVNADGYSDVIVGANGLADGFTNEGRAMVFLGSATGLSMTPFLVVNGGATNAGLGWTVDGIGDFNGDGFSDVAIGATGQDNVRIYVGGLSGMTYFTTTTTLVGGGDGVTAAGDLDYDGYSDLIVGAPGYTNGQNNEGAVQVVYGRSTPPGLPLRTTLIEGNIVAHQFGTGIAGAGDVNGDGYPDVVGGAPQFANGQSQEGRFLVYLGGVGTGGLERRPQQRRVDNTAPIGPLCRSDDSDEFRVALRGRSAEGRATKLSCEWRKAPIRTALALVPIQTDGVTRDTGAPGVSGSVVDLSKVIGYEYPGSPVHWQVRTRSWNPYFPRSRWLTPAWSGVNETDLRLGSAWSAVEEPAAPVAPDVLALSAGPNPFRVATRIAMVMPLPGELDVTVFDPAGRRVATVVHGEFYAGPLEIAWEGNDEAGRPVASGVYFVRARSGSSVATIRLVRTH